jgi:hypothetical protein
MGLELYTELNEDEPDDCRTAASAVAALRFLRRRTGVDDLEVPLGFLQRVATANAQVRWFVSAPFLSCVGASCITRLLTVHASPSFHVDDHRQRPLGASHVHVV